MAMVLPTQANVLCNAYYVLRLECVRRDKARVFRGCNPRPATGSLRPEAIGAAVGGTRPPEPSMQRAVQRPRERAGRNASERRAGPESSDVGADPPYFRGRPTSLGPRETGGIGRPTSDPTQRPHRGLGGGMRER